MQKRHIYEVEIFDSLNAEQKIPSYKDEEVDCNGNKKEGEDERTIPETVKGVPKRNKP